MWARLDREEVEPAWEEETIVAAGSTKTRGVRGVTTLCVGVRLIVSCKLKDEAFCRKGARDVRV